MEIAKTEKSEKRQQARESTEEKLLKVFSAVTPELGKMSENDFLSREVRMECTYALKMIQRINSRMFPPGWPCVRVEEFLNIETGAYTDQVNMFDALRSLTLGRFFKIPLVVVREAFDENKVRFPFAMTVLHNEFHKKKEIILSQPLIKRKAWSLSLPGSKRWSQNSEKV